VQVTETHDNIAVDRQLTTRPARLSSTRYYSTPVAHESQVHIWAVCHLLATLDALVVSVMQWLSPACEIDIAVLICIGVKAALQACQSVEKKNERKSSRQAERC
jgi:hypothetical protein